jgi:hypothetical protein
MTSYLSGDGSAIVEGELREVESPSGLQEQKQQIEWLVDRLLILLPQWRQRDRVALSSGPPRVWRMTPLSVNGSQSSSNHADFPFRARFAKQPPDNVKKRLICSISRTPTPPRMHRLSLWTHTKGREPSGARRDAKMAVISLVENDDPNRFQLN